MGGRVGGGGGWGVDEVEGAGRRAQWCSGTEKLGVNDQAEGDRFDSPM